MLSHLCSFFIFIGIIFEFLIVLVFRVSLQSRLMAMEKLGISKRKEEKSGEIKEEERKAKEDSTKKRKRKLKVKQLVEGKELFES